MLFRVASKRGRPIQALLGWETKTSDENTGGSSGLQAAEYNKRDPRASAPDLSLLRRRRSVSGHDFSRAEWQRNWKWALAPEGS